MKKSALLLLTLATAATITSCTANDAKNNIEPQEPENQEQNENIGGTMGGMQIANPIKSYESAEEIAAVLGFTVKTLPNAENIVFSTISNDVAQVKFTLNSIKYTLRANDEEGDFSGVYTSVESENNINVLVADNETYDVHCKTLTDGNSLITWSNHDGSVFYSLYIEGQPENLSEIIESAVRNNGPSLYDINETFQKVKFQWTEIRTDAMTENGTYPKTAVINSKDELNRYYEENKEKYYLERVEKVYSDTTIGFLDEADKYDDAFFEENILLFVVLENGSGSIRQEVTSVKLSQTSAWVTLKNKIPEICTDDMAYWHIFISIPKADIDPKSIEIVFE